MECVFVCVRVLFQPDPYTQFLRLYAPPPRPGHHCRLYADRQTARDIARTFNTLYYYNINANT